jgi:hypothetical protein
MLVRRHAAISELRPRIPHLPASLDGRWTAVRIERVGAYDVGPANLEIVMWFPIRDDGADGDGPTWATVAREVGPEEGVGDVPINREALGALLPARTDDPRWGAFNVRVTGPLYRAACFEGGGFMSGRAVRVDGGLLVAIATRPPSVPRMAPPTSSSSAA